MAKKEKPKHEEIGDVWMLTYSDLMTLLTCFFLLMMVFANYETPGKSSVADQISESIKKEKNQNDSPTEQIAQEVAKHPDLLEKSKMSVNNNELQITFSSSVLFKEGETKVDHDIEPILQSLIDIIRSRDVNFRVLIEGHSDPYEYRDAPNLDSSWELGALRAAKIISKFEEYGFDPNKLSSVSKGDLEPLEPNKDSEGQPILENMILNRRVVIRVLEPPSDDKKFKFGLGLYFNEKLNE